MKYVTEAAFRKMLTLQKGYFDNQVGDKQDKFTVGRGLKLEQGELSVTLDTSISKVVEELPDRPEEGDENKLFLVLSKEPEGEEGNLYTEYLWINDKWEEMGKYKAPIDLAPYLKDAELSVKVTNNAFEVIKRQTSIGKITFGTTFSGAANSSKLNLDLAEVLSAEVEEGIYKVQVDKYGRITGTEAIIAKDIQDLGFYTSEEIDKTWEDYKAITPYPGPNEIIYTTIDGEAIELEDANIVSNVYYKDKGFGVMECNNKYIPYFTENTKLQSVYIGEGFEVCRINTFKKCINLTKVHLSSKITELLNECFYGCSSLKLINTENVTIYGQNCLAATAIETFTFPENSRLNGTGQLAYCPNLTNLTLHDSMEIIPQLNGCLSLVSVNVPTSLADCEISFRYCYSLVNFDINLALQKVSKLTMMSLRDTRFESITIPGNCKTLGQYSLSSRFLKYLTIREGVEDVNHCMYSSGAILEKLTLPSSLTNLTNAFNHAYAKCIDSSLNRIEYFPLIYYLETLILRSSTLVEDVDTYVSTFTLEEGQELPEGARLIPKPESEIATVSAEDGIMPMTNLDTYIGTPNNWLKIYVPNNLLKAYQERYPTLKNHFHPIQGEDIYATKDAVKDLISESNYTIDFLKGDVVQEYNAGKKFEITGINKINLSNVSLTINSDPANVEPGTEVPQNALLTWSIQKTNEELPAAINITYKVKE